MSRKIMKYSITLKSDACFGSGEGNGSDVDVRTSFDKTGLPVIPGKRLRGLLREKAFMLSEDYGESAIKSLFGDSGIKSRLIVESAEIENAQEIKEYFANKQYNPEEISKCFAVKHTQTKINDKGVAAKSSLRVIETVKQGTVFEVVLYVDDYTENDGKIINDAFSLLRNIGMDKHRGLGEVVCQKLSCEAVNEIGNAGNYSKGTSNFRMEYTLTLEQNVALMLNSPMRNPDYISGATMQGAFARLFAGREDFTQLFFDDLCFGNAYVSDGKAIFEPASMGTVLVKNMDDKAYFLTDDFAKDENCQYVPLGGYENVSGQTVKTLSVQRKTDYHINRGKNNLLKTKKQSFFNVETLEKGQVFKGYIYGSEGALTLIGQVLEKEKSLRIGAAISGEYGKCQIAFGEKEKVESFKFNTGDKVVVKLLSDTIVVDEFGTNSTSVEKLAKAIAKNPTVEAVYTKTTQTGGYNAKWGMPKPQYVAFVKGSELVIECKENVEIPHFIGINNCEGYGMVSARKQYAQNTATLEEATRVPGTGIPTEAQALNCTAGRSLEEEIKTREAINNIKTAAREKANKLYAKYGKSEKVSLSAAMRILSIYQKMVKEDKKTPDEFNYSELKKNTELYNMAEDIKDDFSGNDDKFTVFLGEFLIRYKECARNSKGNGEGQQE